MTQPGTEEARRRAQREKVQRDLDEALADSFPASDPVAIVTSHAEDWDEVEPATEPSTEPSAPESTRPGSRS